MSNKPLDKDSVHRTFQCAREIVLAYGPEDLPRSVRTALCEMMTHYENAALAAKMDAPPPPAGDMVLVPGDDTKCSFADPLLPREMIAAGEDAIDKAHEDLQNYVSGKTIDWDSGMIAVAVYRAMVEWWCRSAPSIHQGGCAPIVTDGVQGDTAPLPAQEVTDAMVERALLSWFGQMSAPELLECFMADNFERMRAALQSALRPGKAGA